MELSEQIKASTIEIFSTMLMMDIVPGEPVTTEFVLHSSVTGMVGLAGTHKGVLAIHVPEKVAMDITANFLGMDVDEVNDDVLDAIGELANMLGGSVKAILSDNGRDIKLSLPTTISGEEYEFQCLDEFEVLIIPFSLSGDGTFLVEFQMEG